MKHTRKIDLMHQQFGATEHKCGECPNLVRLRPGKEYLYKCKVYGITSSEASDWTKCWSACGMFNKEYEGRQIMDLMLDQKYNMSPVDGQIGMEELNDMDLSCRDCGNSFWRGFCD